MGKTLPYPMPRTLQGFLGLPHHGRQAQELIGNLSGENAVMLLRMIHEGLHDDSWTQLVVDTIGSESIDILEGKTEGHELEFDREMFFKSLRKHLQSSEGTNVEPGG